MSPGERRGWPTKTFQRRDFQVLELGSICCTKKGEKLNTLAQAPQADKHPLKRFSWAEKDWEIEETAISFSGVRNEGNLDRHGGERMGK